MERHPIVVRLSLLTSLPDCTANRLLNRRKGWLPVNEEWHNLSLVREELLISLIPDSEIMAISPFRRRDKEAVESGCFVCSTHVYHEVGIQITPEQMMIIVVAPETMDIGMQDTG